MTDDFDELYRREHLGFTRLAYLMVGSAAVAEELVHDAFAALFAEAGEVRNPGGFVRTALVRRCLTWRSRRTMERERLALVGEPPPTGEPEVDETWDALRKVPADRRAVLVLRYYADLSHDEIAELLDIPVATSRSRAHRGLADLRKELEP
jgi:RNA polymerase sigma factor (sigma-70 family)